MPRPAGSQPSFRRLGRRTTSFGPESMAVGQCPVVGPGDHLIRARMNGCEASSGLHAVQMHVGEPLLTCIPHDGGMTDPLPSGPDVEALVRYIQETYPETDTVQAM